MKTVHCSNGIVPPQPLLTGSFRLEEKCLCASSQTATYGIMKFLWQGLTPATMPWISSQVCLGTWHYLSRGGRGGEEGRGSESLQTEYRMGTLKFLIWTCRLIFSITLLTFFLSILRRRLPQDMFLFEFYLFSNFLFGLLVILITESKSVNFVLCAFN